MKKINAKPKKILCTGVFIFMVSFMVCVLIWFTNIGREDHEWQRQFNNERSQSLLNLYHELIVFQRMVLQEDAVGRLHDQQHLIFAHAAYYLNHRNTMNDVDVIHAQTHAINDVLEYVNWVMLYVTSEAFDLENTAALSIMIEYAAQAETIIMYLMNAEISERNMIDRRTDQQHEIFVLRVGVSVSIFSGFMLLLLILMYVWIKHHVVRTTF